MDTYLLRGPTGDIEISEKRVNAIMSQPDINPKIELIKEACVITSSRDSGFTELNEIIKKTYLLTVGL